MWINWNAVNKLADESTRSRWNKELRENMAEYSRIADEMEEIANNALKYLNMQEFDKYQEKTNEFKIREGILRLLTDEISNLELKIAGK